MRQRLAVALPATMAITLALVGNLATGTVQPKVTWWSPAIWAATVLLAATSVGLEIRRRRHTPVAEADLDAAAERLAHSVAGQCHQEQRHRYVVDPIALPVRWCSAAEDLADHPVNVAVRSLGETAEPLPVSGSFDEISDVYRRVPSGRLVVLGAPGSGKTVLLMRLVTQLVEQRTDDVLVPVIVGLATWDPGAVPFPEWLVAQIELDHPAATTSARDLVSAGRILPVLDGFDEMNPGARASALRQINESADVPLVLASRTVQYREVVDELDVLTAAAVIEIEDLPLEDVAHYLPRTTRKPRWGEVIMALTSDPPLAAVLSSPLMIYLARTIYSDAGDADPAELLDRRRLPDVAALQQHLLGAYLPAVYIRPGGAFESGHAERWHRHLARMLTRMGTYDVAWWRLRDAVPRLTRVLVYTVAASVTLEAVLWLAQVESTAATNVGMRLLAACIGVISGLRRYGPAPARAYFTGRRLMRKILTSTGWGLLAATILSVFLGALTIAAMLIPQTGVESDTGPLATASSNAFLVFVLTMPFFILGGAVVGLVRSLSIPIDVTSMPSAANSLAAGRKHSSAKMVGVFLGGPVFLSLLGLLGLGWIVVFVLSVLTAIFGTMIAAFSTAWVQWLLIGRLWLPLTGRLPWRVRAFMADAYERGVFRQSGSVYQFRHALLRDHLAARRAP